MSLVFSSSLSGPVVNSHRSPVPGVGKSVMHAPLFVRWFVLPSNHPCFCAVIFLHCGKAIHGNKIFIKKKKQLHSRSKKILV